MTREEAIEWLIQIKDKYIHDGDEQFDAKRKEALNMAIDALKSDRPKGEWIPIKWHYITDEEREESGYPKDWVYYLDCEMPEDGQEILVTTKHGYVEKDVCYLDDGYSLDSGWDWIEDIVAWMEMPPVYHEDD